MHPPFGNGRWQALDLPDQLIISQLLDHLGERAPFFGQNLKGDIEETLHQMLLVREGRLLTPVDRVRSNDRITVILPLSGG